MKIAIVGGSGFVGTRVIELLQATAEVVNIDKVASKRFPDLSVEANVLNPKQLTAALQGVEAVVLLAAEHKDNVTPLSLYYDVNVEGMRNVLAAMEECGVRRLIFTSSVAVYGLNKDNPSETTPVDPFNDYGKSKWEAEQLTQSWFATHPDWQMTILRPSVIFGEGNRGNVYNLLHQISSGRFLMIGKGNNCKSMAYVGNVAAFIAWLIAKQPAGYEVFNYIDKPDLDMNELVFHVGKTLGKHIPTTHFPYWLGMFGGYCFDVLGKLTGRKLTISSVRVKKFCAVTQFDAAKVAASGFEPPFTLEEGLRRTLQFEFGK